MDDVWVVLACRIGSQENFWAWCRPMREAPGFDEIFYTKRDGTTAWSPSGETLPQLGEHLFTVVFPAREVASTGERFPESRELSPDQSWRPQSPTLEQAGPDAGGA